MTQMTERLRILVVEDEVLIAMNTADTLADLGHSVDWMAPDLSRALEIAASEPVGLAILDVNLNREMSFPVARVLAGRGIPFLFVTGYGSQGLDPDLAGSTVVGKPFTSEMLADAIKAAVSSGDTAVAAGRA